MKKIAFLLAIVISAMTIFAQSPQAFKYQAVARTSTGNLIQNQLVAFRISLLQGGPSGTMVYQERHTTNTNNYGLANLDIGNGTILSGSFSTIDWSAGTMFIKAEFDPLGGTAYQNMGTSQLLSVPYALYSNASAGLTLPYSGTVSSDASALSVTNTGTGHGISGTATNSSGYGVYGTAPVTGIKGLATNGSGENYGVYGQSNSAQGCGVYGKVTASVGVNYGVYGEAPSELGYGVYGTGGRSGVIGNGSTEGATGVAGINSFETGNGIGVWGLSSSVSGIGIRGLATSLSGVNYGVYGTTESPNGYGVFGSGIYCGIKGVADYPDYPCFGVIGISNSTQGNGVFGGSTANTGQTYAVMGQAESTSGCGVYGYAVASTGVTKGVYGQVLSPQGFSGYFNGGKFYIQQNVGVGTAEPDCQLSVRAPSTGSMDLVNVKNISDNNLFRLRQSSNGSGGFYIYDGSNNNTIFLYGEGNSFINSGNLGIGTNVPAYKLDVAGITNLNKGIASGVALRVNSDEALWYNGTYFSWGYAGNYNFFGNKLKIAGNGNVAPSYELVVEGNAAKSSGGSTWIVSSDLRLKELHGNYNKGLKEIIALQPVRFLYKEGNPYNLPSEQEQIGFVAQEVQKIFPEAVNEDYNGYLGFNMHPVNVALINAIKELKAENDKMKMENQEMKMENQEIKARLDKLESSLNLSSK